MLRYYQKFTATADTPYRLRSALQNLDTIDLIQRLMPSQYTNQDDKAGTMSSRKRDKASTPARGKETGEGGAKDMDLSDSEGIQKPPSILKKSSTVPKEMKSPDKKKTRKSKDGDTDGGSKKGKGGKPRGRSKSREGGAKGSASKSRSPSKARSTSKTPKQRSQSTSRSTSKEPN
jgi:hypothetical protein